MVVTVVSKTRNVWPVLLMAVAGSMAMPSSLHAQSVTLSLSPTAFSFASADPDTTPTITGSPAVTVTYSVSGTTKGSGGWTMTLIASTDLTAGTATIPITNMTWTATPVPPFRSGTMSRTVAQTLASASGNKGSSTGTVTFRLANSWSYNVGTYTASIIFTITAT